ncbi:MAG: RNA methyltransferase [Burkholderiales bacterium]|nr:RNA methyltransferase [Phycisphaerae bacterium]
MSAITDLSDPRVAPFADVTRNRGDQSSAHFIAEGENVVYRLLASDYHCQSVLCVDRKADRLRPRLQPGTELLVATESLMQQILGFKFHSGVMGLGVRKPVTGIEDAITTIGDKPATVLALPEITDSANLGAILRIAAAFGVHTVLLGQQCRDPFVRQTIRVSMGTIFSLRIAHAANIAEDLKKLRSEHGFELIATVLDADAEPLRQVVPARRRALLLGNEGPGLVREIVEICDRRVTIPMRLGTDSLNVAAACGVFLFHICGDAAAGQ